MAGCRVVADETFADLVGRLAQARGSSDLAGPLLEQLVAARLLAAADEILPARRVLLRESRDALVQALRDALPDWRCVSPRAGMVLWVELPRPAGAGAGADLGLRITPGPRFTLDGSADRCLRLPFTLPVGQIPQVVAVLAQARSRAGSGRQPHRIASHWSA